MAGTPLVALAALGCGLREVRLGAVAAGRRPAGAAPGRDASGELQENLTNRRAQQHLAVLTRLLGNAPGG